MSLGQAMYAGVDWRSVHKEIGALIVPTSPARRPMDCVVVDILDSIYHLDKMRMQALLAECVYHGFYGKRVTIGFLVRTMISCSTDAAFPIMLKHACEMMDEATVLDQAVVEIVQSGRTQLLSTLFETGRGIVESWDWTELFKHMRMRWAVYGGQDLVQRRLQQLWPCFPWFVKQSVRTLIASWAFELDSDQLAKLVTV